MENIDTDVFEYKVTVLTNGEKHLRYYYTASKEAAMLRATQSFIANPGYRQEVIGAEFTGRVMRNGVVR